MKSGKKLLIVLVTTPDLKTARGLAQAALKKRLAACANVIPKVESHYWWQGKIETGAEALMVMKTTTSHVDALEKLILELHPYDTPEFVVADVAGANRRYRDWWLESTKKPKARATRKRS